MMERATSETTRRRESRVWRRPMPEPRAPSRRFSICVGLADWRAGARPKRTPVTMEMKKVKKRTPESMETSLRRGGSGGGGAGSGILGKGPGEEKIGDVDAGDEEDEGDGAEEDEEFGALRADEVFFNGDEADGPAGGGGIFFGIRARELRDVGVDLMLGLRDGEAWFKAADGAGKKTLRAIGRNRKWRASESGGEPDVDIGIESAAGMTEVGRHDADDGVEVGIEAHFAAGNVGVGAVVGVPESVGDNDGIEEGGDGVLGSVNAAEFGLGAEESEVVGTGEEAFGANGAVTTADGGV